MNVARSWNKFWFSDAPYFDLALMRIVVVAFHLYFLLDSQYPNLLYALSLPHDLYRIDPRVLRLFAWPFGYLHTPPYASIVFTVFGVTVAAGFVALFGVLTRTSMVVFALGNLLMQAFIFSFVDYHHPEAIGIIGLMALALSPCGRVMSLESWWRGRRASGTVPSVSLLDYSGPYAGWPIRFIQCFFPLMYISAAVAKIAFAGYTLDWANGYTLQYYFIQDNIRKGAELGLWASQFHWFILIGQVVVLFYQITYFLVVPFKKLRWIYVPLGLTFHLANYLIIRAPFPLWILFLLLAYIPWSTALKMLLGAKVVPETADVTARSPVDARTQAPA